VDKTGFRPHHVAISVRDVPQTLDFYGLFGFEEVVHWTAQDNSLQIIHLLKDGFCLEVFCYATNGAAAPCEFELGNDLEQLGVKHFAIHVPDLRKTHAALMDLGHPVSDIRRGRTEVDYFFVRDPDGIWFELVQEERNLDPSAPRRLTS